MISGFDNMQVHRRVRSEAMSDIAMANKLTCMDSLKPSLVGRERVYSTS